MRIHLRTTPNTSIIPFDYQSKVIGTIHKWLGNNEIHDKMSLYSFSRLLGGKKVEDQGFDFPGGADFFISFYENEFLSTLIQTILTDPDMFGGLKVKEVLIDKIPEFREEGGHYFKVASPVLIKRASEGTWNYKYYFYDNEESGDLMTESLKHKMRLAGLPEDDTLKVEFDQEFRGKCKKMITIHRIKNLVSMCPVIVHGKASSKEFAWIVGIGNSTGSGFGSLF